MGKFGGPEQYSSDFNMYPNLLAISLYSDQWLWAEPKTLHFQPADR